MKPVSAAAAFLFFIPLLSGCRAEKPVEKPPPPVKIQTIQEFTEETGIRFSGTIRPNSQVELSFRNGGFVQDILKVRGGDGRLRLAQEGDRITQGTVLADLRQEDSLAKENQIKSQLIEAEAAVNQAKAQFSEVSAALHHARLDFERAESLFLLKSLIKPDYDASKARLESAQARVEGAQAQVSAAQAKVQGTKAALEEIGITLKDTILQAPMNGLILKRNIELGSLAQPGVPAFIFSDNSMVKMVFGISDLMMAKLRPASKVRVVTEALQGFEFLGHISRISSSADPVSRLFEAEVLIPNPHNRLKPGMIASVQVFIAKPTQPLIVVPFSALFRPPGQSTGFAVFILEERSGNKVARIRPVHLGRLVENQMEISQGLKTGERVIISGSQLVSDGQMVNIIP